LGSALPAREVERNKHDFSQVSRSVPRANGGSIATDGAFDRALFDERSFLRRVAPALRLRDEMRSRVRRFRIARVSRAWREGELRG
jgi:hypothetical protein